MAAFAQQNRKALRPLRMETRATAALACGNARAPCRLGAESFIRRSVVTSVCWNPLAAGRVVEKRAYSPFYSLTRIYSRRSVRCISLSLHLSSGPLTNVVDTFEPDDSSYYTLELKDYSLGIKVLLPISLKPQLCYAACLRTAVLCSQSHGGDGTEHSLGSTSLILTES